MEQNICTRCNVEKIMKIFTINIPNVKKVIVIEV